MSMRSSDFPELLDTPLRKIFFQMELPRAEYPSWVNIVETRRNFEDDLRMAEFGAVPAAVEGDVIIYDDAQELQTKRYTPELFALGFNVTQIMREDDQHGQIVKLTKSLRKSMRYRFEVTSANLFNGCTATTLERDVGFDDLALLSTAHTDGDGGTQSNRPTTAVVISNTAVEAGVKAFHGWKDQRGVMPILAVPTMAVVSGDYQFIAARIFKNAMRYDTADNDENWIRKGPDGNGISTYLVSRYLTNTKYWFLLADKSEHDLNLFIRVQPEFQTSVDFQTGNYMVKCRARLQASHGDWRGVYGSPAT